MLRRAMISAALWLPPVKRLWEDRQRLSNQSAVLQERIAHQDADLATLNAEVAKLNAEIAEVAKLNAEMTKLIAGLPAENPHQEKHLFPFKSCDRLNEGSQPPAANFLVTSWGHSGSIWFAGSLNLHERVFCSVGVGHPLPSFMIFNLNKNIKGWAEQPHERLYKYGITPDEESYLVRHGLQGRNVRDIADLPRFVFDELETILSPSGNTYSVLGNVHGTTLDQLQRRFKADPATFAGRSVVVMDLIRHPVPRTESAIKATINLYLEQHAPAITDYIAKNAQECLDLERKYKIDFSEPRVRAALHVYRQGIQNDVWVYELVSFPNIQRILMERLQNEPEYFSSVFHILSHGREVADKAFLDRVFSNDNLVAGRQTAGEMNARTLSPTEQYARWSRWEQDEFSRIAERLRMPRVYLEHGYDFSFLSRAPFSGGSWFPDSKSA